MTSIKLAIAVVFSFVLVACAGTAFEWRNARKIRDGMTAEEVTKLVGAPNTVRTQGEVTRYVWVYVNSFEGTRTLVIDFKDGKVIKAPPIPASFN